MNVENYAKDTAINLAKIFQSHRMSVMFVPTEENARQTEHITQLNRLMLCHGEDTPNQEAKFRHEAKNLKNLMKR